MNRFEEVTKIYSYFEMLCTKSLLNPIHHNRGILFKLIMKENNITSLLGGNIFVTSLNTFFFCMNVSLNNTC